MISLVQLAAELQAFCLSRKWQFCFIGGLAVQLWGEARVTRDVDLTILTGFGDEEAYIDALCDRFRSRIANAREFAIRQRVLLLESDHGIAIDVGLGGLPFEEEVVRRAKDYDFLNGTYLRTCTAEDLIVLKAFADRDRDWLDVHGIIIRQGEGLDWAYIRRQLTPLCELKETRDIMGRLEETRRRLREA